MVLINGIYISQEFSVSSSLGFLQERLEDAERSLATAKLNAQRDNRGLGLLLLESNLKIIAVLQYVVNKDVSSFRQGLSDSASVRIGLFERFNEGVPYDPSCVSMMSYMQLLDGLASNDIGVAKRLAHLMGGRPKIETANSRAFEINIGYALKHVLAGDYLTAHPFIEGLLVACRNRPYLNFSFYPVILRAIVNAEPQTLNTAFDGLIAEHKKESTGHGLFALLPDEHLCVWGVGLANLARWRGLPVDVDDPLLPRELIAPQALS